MGSCDHGQAPVRRPVRATHHVTELDHIAAREAARPRIRLPGLSAHAQARDMVAQGAGIAALGGLLVGAALIAIRAAARPSFLVPASQARFPGWIAGPLHGLAGASLSESQFALVMLAMGACYLLSLGVVRSLSLSVVAGVVIVLHVILALSPPLELTDIFNYLGFARLGALHGLNPYAHGAIAAPGDPAIAFDSWRYLHSPYGPLFTLASYAIAPLGVAGALWVLKATAAVASLACVALVGFCARRLALNPVRAVALVGLNPLVLVYGVGGGHNDFIMLALLLGGVALTLARREAGGALAIVAAAAVKATGAIVLPFQVLGSARRGRALASAAVAALAGLAVSFALFGPSLTSALQAQAQCISKLSFPDALGRLAGAGGAVTCGSPRSARAARRRLRLAAEPDAAGPLDHARGLGHARPAREPDVADALVRRLAPAAGRPERQPAAAHGGDGRLRLQPARLAHPGLHRDQQRAAPRPAASRRRLYSRRRAPGTQARRMGDRLPLGNGHRSRNPRADRRAGAARAPEPSSAARPPAHRGRRGDCSAGRPVRGQRDRRPRRRPGRLALPLAGPAPPRAALARRTARRTLGGATQLVLVAPARHADHARVHAPLLRRGARAGAADPAGGAVDGGDRGPPRDPRLAAAAADGRLQLRRLRAHGRAARSQPVHAPTGGREARPGLRPDDVDAHAERLRPVLHPAHLRSRPARAGRVLLGLQGPARRRQPHPARDRLAPRAAGSAGTAPPRSSSAASTRWCSCSVSAETTTTSSRSFRCSRPPP